MTCEKLQGRTNTLSYLKYELKTEDIYDQDKNKFTRYSMFNNSIQEPSILEPSILESSIVEHSNNQFNFFECEGEYSKVIGISLYNETYNELESTLISIFKNRQHESSGGKFFLNKTLVVIISDGVDYLDKSIKENFKTFKLFDSDIIKSNYTEEEKKNNNDITFFFQGELGYNLKENSKENTTSLNILKVVFGVKTENKKKLHSHMLLLMICCRKIKPEYVIVSFN